MGDRVPAHDQPVDPHPPLRQAAGGAGIASCPGPARGHIDVVGAQLVGAGQHDGLRLVIARWHRRPVALAADLDGVPHLGAAGGTKHGDVAAAGHLHGVQRRRTDGRALIQHQPSLVRHDPVQGHLGARGLRVQGEGAGAVQEGGVLALIVVLQQPLQARRRGGRARPRPARACGGSGRRAGRGPLPCPAPLRGPVGRACWKRTSSSSSSARNAAARSCSAQPGSFCASGALAGTAAMTVAACASSALASASSSIRRAWICRAWSRWPRARSARSSPACTRAMASARAVALP